MASHLTITSAVAAPHTLGTQPTGKPQSGEDGNALGVFASLLGNTTTEAPATTGQVTLDTAIGNVFSLGLEAGFGEPEGEAEIESGEVVASLVPADPAPVVNLVQALGMLKASLDAGQPLDPDLLEQVDAALTDLAKALGLDPDALPVPQDFVGLLETGAEDTGLAGALTQLLAPLANSISTAGKGDDAAAIADEGAARTQIKEIGDKLAAILSALETGAVPDDKLAALGMPPGQPALAEIDEALARFAAGLADIAVPDEPALALPALKLTEPVLAGKTADTSEIAPSVAQTSEPVEAAPKSEDRPDQSTDQSPRERVDPRREPSTTTAFVAPAANETAPAETQPTSQTIAPRVDSAAATRAVVQPGYQTSQQQLNLPQIAFELGRQIQGGNTRFQIRLDPPELGRIDVRLEFDNTGTVNARLTVEKSETLDLMQRDQRGLQLALQQAGIDSGKTNLEFSLKQNPFAGQPGMEDRQNGRGGNGSANDNGATADAAPEPTPTVNLYRGTLQARGINIIA